MPSALLVVLVFLIGFSRKRASGAAYLVIAMAAIVASLWHYLG